MYLVLVTFVICINYSYSQFASFSFEHINVLNSDQLSAFKESPNVHVVYYYMRVMPRLRSFFKEYDKSCEFLKVYGVSCGVFDCSIPIHSEEHDICQTDMVENKVYTYKHGSMLLALELQTMFDVNSIMSNILQLVLLQEVPILQTQDAIQEYEYKYKGSKDIIFTYQKAIGTYEHKIFMEVAYAFMEDFQFALSTNKEALVNFPQTTDLDKSVVIWLLECKDMTGKADVCTRTQYQGPMDLSSLAMFIRILNAPKVFDIPTSGLSPPLIKEDVTTVYLYYLPHQQQDVDAIATTLANAHKGMYCIVTVNQESKSHNPYPFDGELPALLYKIRGEREPRVMPYDFEIEKVLKFVKIMISEQNKNLLSHKPVHPHKKEKSPEEVEEEEEMTDDMQDSKGEYSEPDISGVETQDDALAEAVYKNRHARLNLDNVLKLTDKSFNESLHNKPLVFVLFYLPFDDVSMAVLHTYSDISNTSQNAQALARVNCHDWTDVCSKENITLYPTVRIYKDGHSLTDYKGLLDSNEILKTYQLLKFADMVNLESSTDIKSYFDGVLPDGQSVLGGTAVLGLFGDKHKKEAEAFQRVHNKMKGTILFAMNSNGMGIDSAKTHFDAELPLVTVVRRLDAGSHVYTKEFNSQKLEDFINEAKLPVMPELTVQMFPTLYKQQKPLVIAFLDESEESVKLKTVLTNIVTENKYTSVVICWIRVNGNNLGGRILKKYNEHATLPALSYLQLDKGKVTTYEGQEFTTEVIKEWLSSTTGVEKMLPQGEWKPKKEGYNYLTMMDWEHKNMMTYDSREMQTVEEHGIGFDADGNEVTMYMPEDAQEPNGVSTKSEEEEAVHHTFSDEEAREELLRLQKSRLYHNSAARRKIDIRKGKTLDQDGNSQQEHHQHQEL